VSIFLTVVQVKLSKICILNDEAFSSSASGRNLLGKFQQAIQMGSDEIFQRIFHPLKGLSKLLLPIN